MKKLEFTVVFTFLSLAAVMLSGCSDSGQGTSSQAEEQNEEETQNNDTEINILTSVFPSPKEQNPYAVENMNQTFRNLILANNPNAKDIPELEANFLYVRFLPYGKQGEYELKTYDPGLVLFKYPMDYNEIRKPVVYIDETLPDSIVPYFASVPVGYEFGSTPYEILQELFLTQPLEEDDGDDQEDSRFVKAKKSNKANKEIAAYLKSQGLSPYQLEMAALPDLERLSAEIENGSSKILAKNVPYDMDNVVAWSWPKWNRWRPCGILKFIDEKKGEVALVGIRVTAGYLFYWRSSKTDKNGYFESPERWTFAVRYEAHFDSDQFLLQDGHSFWGLDLDYVKDGTSYQPWYHTFIGDQTKRCVIWTAAYNYWYGDIYGLARPRNNGWLNHSLEINVYDKNATDWNEAQGRYTTGSFVESIKILAYGRTHLGIYGTTIHEIAHASHYTNGKYSSSPTRLRESYARGIERYLTLKRYGTWDGDYSLWRDGYTGLFEDLEDTNSKYARDVFYCDKVGGITVPMAEKALFESDSWDGFKNNLMKKYPNGTSNSEDGKVTYTKADMNALFDFWETGKTSCLTDSRDGKDYRTTIIGTQTWMAENLNYNAAGSKCYSDNTNNCATYGRLYDWSTAMALPSSCNSSACSDQVNAKHKGACPTGWHIPSVADWDKLLRYVDGDESTYSPYDSPTAGMHLKAENGWRDSDNGSGKDTYGFSALPGGIGYPNNSGFRFINHNGDWWSVSEYDDIEAYRVDMYYSGDKAGWEDIDKNRKHDKSRLFSIRCVKD